MVFHRSSAHEIGWAGVRPNGDVVSGTLVLGASVVENMVTTWAELSIDPPDANVMIDPAHLRLLSPRSTSTAERVATRYMRDSGGLVPVDGEDEEPVDDEGEQVP
jgi:hypothetical protein